MNKTDKKVLEYLKRAGKINEKFITKEYVPTEVEAISMWKAQVRIAKMIQLEEKK